MAVAADDTADSAELSTKLPGVSFANDRPLQVVAAYGRREGDHPKPATFIVDETGVVRFAHVDQAEEWPTVDAVRAALAALPAPR